MGSQAELQSRKMKVFVLLAAVCHISQSAPQWLSYAAVHPVASVVTGNSVQLPLEDTRLWLDPMETLLDPSTRFPDSSPPSPSRNRKALEMLACPPELVLLPLPTLSMPSMPQLPTMERDQQSPNWSMPESQPTTMLSPMPSQLLLSSL